MSHLQSEPPVVGLAALLDHSCKRRCVVPAKFRIARDEGVADLVITQ